MKWNIKVFWNYKEPFAKRYLIWQEPLLNAKGHVVIIFLVTSSMPGGQWAFSRVHWAVLGAGQTTGSLIFHYAYQGRHYQWRHQHCQDSGANEGKGTFMQERRLSQRPKKCLRVFAGLMDGTAYVCISKRKNYVKNRERKSEEDKIWWIHKNPLSTQLGTRAPWNRGLLVTFFFNANNSSDIMNVCFTCVT